MQSTDPAQRSILRVAEHAFTTAHCELDILAGPGCGTALTHKLVACAPGYVNVVW